jgi:hypothetical protein
MNATDKYTLSVPPAYRILVFGTMILFSLMGVGMIVAALRRGPETVPLPFAVFWCAALIWNWYGLLNPLWNDGTEEHRAANRRAEIVRDTASVACEPPASFDR